MSGGATPAGAEAPGARARPPGPAAPVPLVELCDLHFAWPGDTRATLAIGHYRIEAGQTLFMHGPSGCGKSTLLGLLAGVLLPQAGEVRLQGVAWQSLPAGRRDPRRADLVGVVFQQFNLLPYLSVLDNVLLPCRFSKRRAEAAGDAPAEARRLLQRMGLPEAAWRRAPLALSVGQQQRVAAARALIGRPPLVIADEPTSALDEDLRERFVDVLLGACADAGSTLVFVSHDRRLAPRFASQCALPLLNHAATLQGADA